MPTFYTEADLPLATETVTITVELDHGVEVQRKIMEGTRVPADLVEAWREQTGGAKSEGEDRAQEQAEADAKLLAEVQEAEANAKPGEVPESEKGDPAPARRAKRRAGP